MSVRKAKKLDRLMEAVSYGEFGALNILLLGLAVVFTLPWTIIRLARVAWHIESKQGQTDHHKRIIKILVVYLIFWTIGVGVVALGYWIIQTQLGA